MAALLPREKLSSKEVNLQRRIFSLLFPIAGVLLSQSVQAQTPPITFPVVADGQHIDIPAGTYHVSGNNVFQASIVLALNGGSITGNGVMLIVQPSTGTQVMQAFGPKSSISMMNTVINMTNANNATTD